MPFSMRVVNTAAHFGACLAGAMRSGALSGFSYHSATTSFHPDNNGAVSPGSPFSNPRHRLIREEVHPQCLDPGFPLY